MVHWMSFQALANDLDVRLFSMRHLLSCDGYKSYKADQRKYCDIATVTPAAALFLLSFVLKIKQGYVVRGYLSYLKHLCHIIFGVLFLTYLISRNIVHRTEECNRSNYCYIISKRWLNLCSRELIENFSGICFTLMIGLQFVDDVFVPQCESDPLRGDEQICNESTKVGPIPEDQVILLYSIPLIAQSAFRGISLLTLTFSWAVILAIVVIGGFLNSWTLLYSGIFMNITFVTEMLKRSIFIEGESVLAAAKLDCMRDVDFNAVSCENERKVSEMKLSQLRSLMGNVAHDLKTPLHAIEADLDVLRVCISSLRVGGAVASLVNCDPIFNSLTATCNFMSMAISRSQDFMKTSNNIALVPVLETFEIASALSMSVDCINHLQTGRVIKVHPLGYDICPYLISDKHWLCENILCLLSNAIKYSDDGDVDVRIQVVNSTDSKPIGKDPLPMNEAEDTVVPLIIISKSVESTMRDFSIVKNDMDRKVVFSFEDRGIGITEEARRDLFQPFQQAQRMAGGTGLGLYSLAKRIDALGGTYGIGDRTDGGQGSKFWFAFPYRPDEAARAYAVSGAIPGLPGDTSETESLDYCQGQGQLSSKSRRVLLVDDSSSILKVTSRQLEYNGHSVKTARNGSIGLKMLKEAYKNQGYDILLIDLQMPVMDGIEATRRYREFEAAEMKAEFLRDGVQNKKNLLIIGMSASSDNTSQQEALDSGMNYFSTKPFKYSCLRAIFDSVEPSSQASTTVGKL